MKLLITGGAGFIGSALVKELNDQGIEDILIVDRLRDTSKWLNLRGVKFTHYIHADEFFSEENEGWLRQLKMIYHMGACSSTTEMDMDYLMKNNVEYSQKLFRLATERDIPIIYASSAATYGDGSKGYNDKRSQIPELRPLNPYGYSKQLFDEWVLKQTKKPKHWFGLKFFNVYGPGEYHKGSMRSVVHQAFEQIRDGGKVKLFKSHHPDYADGMQLRDFIYVKDITKAMVMMSDSAISAYSGIFNMGTGRAQSFKELVEATFKAMQTPVNIEYIAMPDHLKDQYQYYTQANMTKFMTLFPDFQFRDVEHGVEDYVKNYLLNPAGPYF
jgi:ADP-L-glycero-D-manno-heptose 6-epimerase